MTAQDGSRLLPLTGGEIVIGTWVLGMRSFSGLTAFLLVVSVAAI